MKKYIPLACLLVLTLTAQGAEPLRLPAMFDKPAANGGLVMTFYIESVVPDERGNPVFTVAAADGEKRASFQVVVGKKWRPLGSVKPELAKLYMQGSVTVRSAGPATEVFARAYARACKTRVRSFQFNEFEFGAISIDSDPARMMKDVVHMKLQQGAIGSGEYFGIYCTIDVSSRLFIFREREEISSRELLVRVFTGDRPNNESEKTKG